MGRTQPLFQSEFENAADLHVHVVCFSPFGSVYVPAGFRIVFLSLPIIYTT